MTHHKDHLPTTGVLTVPQTSRVFGTSPWALYSLIRTGGELPVKPIRVGRKLLFPTSAVANILGLTTDELLALLEDGNAQ